MANSTGTHAYLGAAFVDSSSNGAKTYASVGNIVKMNPPNMKRGKSNTAHLASAGEAKTFKPGWIDGDMFKFTILMKASDYNTLFTYFTTDTDTRYFKIRYNDGTGATTGSVLEFLGMIEELGDAELSRDSDDPIQTEVSVKVSGLPTFAVAT